MISFQPLLERKKIHSSEDMERSSFTLTCMGQAESPQTQIRRSVRDASQAELDGVNGLQHEDVAHAGRLLATSSSVGVLCVLHVLHDLFTVVVDGRADHFAAKLAVALQTNRTQNIIMSELRNTGMSLENMCVSSCIAFHQRWLSDSTHWISMYDRTGSTNKGVDHNRENAVPSEQQLKKAGAHWPQLLLQIIIKPKTHKPS